MNLCALRATTVRRRRPSQSARRDPTVRAVPSYLSHVTCNYCLQREAVESYQLVKANRLHQPKWAQHLANHRMAIICQLLLPTVVPFARWVLCTSLFHLGGKSTYLRKLPFQSIFVEEDRILQSVNRML